MLFSFPLCKSIFRFESIKPLALSIKQNENCRKRKGNISKTMMVTHVTISLTVAIVGGIVNVLLSIFMNILDCFNANWLSELVF